MDEFGKLASSTVIVDDDEIDDIWEVVDALKNATPEQIDRILDIL
jgi:hypothetical protein